MGNNSVFTRLLNNTIAPAGKRNLRKTGKFCFWAKEGLEQTHGHQDNIFAPVSRREPRAGGNAYRRDVPGNRKVQSC
jgi:hypothetical protein